MLRIWDTLHHLTSFICVSDGSKSVEYCEKTLEEAVTKVEKMGADLGGTEILQSLKHIYNQPCIPNQPRQVNTLMHIHHHVSINP